METLHGINVSLKHTIQEVTEIRNVINIIKGSKRLFEAFIGLIHYIGHL